MLARAQRAAADERAVSPPAKKKLKTRRTSALKQARTKGSSDSSMGDGPSVSQPAGQSSAEHDDRPSTAHPWERLVQCTAPSCNRSCDPVFLRRGPPLCCETCGDPRVQQHTAICNIVHSAPFPAFALSFRRLEPRRQRRITDASVPRDTLSDLIANDPLLDLVAPPVVAEHSVEAARGVIWDLVAGPPLQNVSHTASAANTAVDAVSRRPSSPTELGLDAANPSNSMGDGPASKPAAFPRFGTRDASSPAVVVARPGQFLSFATPTPVPMLGDTPRRYR